jgi:site-specific DNA recombinase
MARAKQSAPSTIEHVAGYIRVSTDEQAQSGLGLADQRRRIAGMAAAKDWPEPTVYADEGVSGTKEAKDRPALAHLLADMRAGKIDAVIILSLDRLARKSLIVLDLVDIMNRAGVSLVSCKESLDTTTPQGQFVLTIFAALAQLERDLISERTRAALAELGRTTGDRGGRLPYGYLRTADGVLRIEQATAAIVRRIFSARRRGDSLRDIAHKLNVAGVVSPLGGAWGHTTVASILSNRALYAGGKRADSPQRWPAILGKREGYHAHTERAA